MDRIEYPKIIENQLLEREEFEYFASLPKLLMKTLLKTTLYKERGLGSSYVISGFALSELRQDAGIWTQNITPGIGLMHDVTFSSLPGTEYETCILKSDPEDRDMIVLTYDEVTEIYEDQEKYSVNDVTRSNSATDIMIETKNSHVKTTVIIPKFIHLKSDEYYDPYKCLGLFQYSEKLEEFILVRLEYSVNLSQHRDQEKAPHPEGSVTTRKISEGITGTSGTTKVVIDDRNITIHEMSVQTKEICGNFDAPNAQRLNGVLGGILGYDIGWKVNTTGNFYGIDNIFLEKCRNILLQGVESTGGGGGDWRNYVYKSAYTPSIAYETLRGFILNPAAIMHSAHGTRCGARSGVLGYDGHIDSYFDGTGNIPHGIDFSDTEPSIQPGDTAVFCSLKQVYFQNSGTSSGAYQDDKFFMYSIITLDPITKRVVCRSGITKYNTFVDTRWYKGYNAGRFFDSYDKDFDGDPPDGLDHFGTSSYESRKTEYNAGSNYFIIGKLGSGPPRIF